MRRGRAIAKSLDDAKRGPKFLLPDILYSKKRLCPDNTSEKLEQRFIDIVLEGINHCDNTWF